MKHKTVISEYAEFNIGRVVKHDDDGTYGHVIGFDTIGAEDILRIRVLWADGETSAEFPEFLCLLKP